MIRELGESIGNTVVETVGRAVGRAQESRPLPVDLLESDDAYLAVFDAPGATASDVQVRFEDDEIQVRVDRFRDFHEGFEMRFPGRGLALDGHVELPDGASVDPGGATATLADNGTLQVRVPKTDEGSGEDARVAVEEESDEPEDGDGSEDEGEASADDGSHDADGGTDENDGTDGNDGA
ncbi:MAG: Hsp20 family protein [Haloarculaceae archaeon]